MRNPSLPALAILLLAAGTAAAADDTGVALKPMMGECSTCHARTADDRIGPLLSGAGGRTGETVTGFRFCDGSLAPGSVWSRDPRDDRSALVMPGTDAAAAGGRDVRMAFLRSLSNR
ncbi:MAG: cytochrome c family protein [Alphaproteobacteria bacterium]